MGDGEKKEARRGGRAEVGGKYSSYQLGYSSGRLPFIWLHLSSNSEDCSFSKAKNLEKFVSSLNCSKFEAFEVRGSTVHRNTRVLLLIFHQMSMFQGCIHL